MVRRGLSALFVLGCAVPLFAHGEREGKTLEWLVENEGSCTIGDKRFDNFTIGQIGGEGSYLVDPGEIYVSFSMSPEGDYIALFDGTILALASSGTPSSAHLAFSFDVTVLDASMWIDAAGLSIAGSTTGVGGTAVVDETLYDPLSAMDVGMLSTDLTNPPTSLSDAVDFSPDGYPKLRITKDITVTSGPEGYSETHLIEERFTQARVPEPLTLGLFGLGGVAIWWFRRA